MIKLAGSRNRILKQVSRLPINNGITDRKAIITSWRMYVQTVLHSVDLLDTRALIVNRSIPATTFGTLRSIFRWACWALMRLRLLGRCTLRFPLLWRLWLLLWRYWIDNDKILSLQRLFNPHSQISHLLIVSLLLDQGMWLLSLTPWMQSLERATVRLFILQFLQVLFFLCHFQS